MSAYTEYDGPWRVSLHYEENLPFKAIRKNARGRPVYFKQATMVLSVDEATELCAQLLRANVDARIGGNWNPTIELTVVAYDTEDTIKAPRKPRKKGKRK